MSATRRGLDGERRIATLLGEMGYLVASRRHVGGAGDLMALSRYIEDRPLLIEVKTTSSGPFSCFPPADRAELIATAERYGCEALLAYTPTPSVVVWLPPEDWPRLEPSETTEEEKP